MSKDKHTAHTTVNDDTCVNIGSLVDTNCLKARILASVIINIVLTYIFEESSEA